MVFVRNRSRTVAKDLALCPDAEFRHLPPRRIQYAQSEALVPADTVDLVAQYPFPSVRIANDEVQPISIAVPTRFCGLNRPFCQARHLFQSHIQSHTVTRIGANVNGHSRMINMEIGCISEAYVDYDRLWQT